MKYTIISPSSQDLEATQKILDKLPYKNYYVIEYGDDGTCEKYYIVWLETDKRTDKYKEILLRLYEPRLENVSRYFITTKHVKDLTGLLGYITKEPNHKIVGKMPDEHKEILKTIQNKPKKPVSKYVMHPSSSEFPLLIQSFVLEYFVNEKHVELQSVIDLMIAKHIKIVNLLPRIKYHAYVARELLLRQNNIVLKSKWSWDEI